ncbi:MAG: DnaJ domain-containing protein [Proteobacteria bacterium]|nr:DnaJ domain-containing protein [Pseudomonadota bacterium]
MAEKDLYGVLGLARGASDEEIKKAYRELARKLHPDRNPNDKQAEERFKDVAYAKEILTNPKKKKLYDEFGHLGLREGFNPDAYRQYQSWGSRSGAGPAVNLEDLLGGRGGAANWRESLQDLFGASGGFETIFGGQRAAKRRGQDLVAPIRIGFLEAVRGTEKEISYGLGGDKGSRSLRVRIPAGVTDGGRVRLRGQGLDGGDLVLRVSVEGHRFLTREGNDLHLELPVTVGEAYRGAKIRVPTLEGEVTLRIPAGVQSGAKLRLRSKGVPAHGKAGVGDMIVHVQLRLPGGEARELGELVDRMEAAYERHPREHLVL